MKLIVRPRGGGKTTELVRLSAQTGATIVCSHDSNAHYYISMAKSMGLEIPLPISFYEFTTRGPRGRDAVIVDDADQLLRQMAGPRVEVIAASLTGSLEVMEGWSAS